MKRLITRYPWDRWFIKKRFRLVKGGHYVCKTHGMAAQVRNAAHIRNLSISLSIDDGSIEVHVNGDNGPKKLPTAKGKRHA